MKNPLGVSTLEEAASWLSEYSGRQWSAREVLDLGFKRSLADFQRDGVEASPTLWAALPPSTRFVFRRWTVERGCERRPTDWQLVPITYENVFALLCGGGSVAVEFPRASDPWDGEDRLCIDSPDTHVLVSIDMLRVYARDLVCLAAESTASAETEQSVSTDQPRSADAEPGPEEAEQQDEAEPAAKKKPGRKPSDAPDLLARILDALEQFATGIGEPFDRHAMPGPLGENYDEHGSFHWLCAKIHPTFRKAKATFEKQRSGICAVGPYAKRTDFYRRALPHIAPKLMGTLIVNLTQERKKKIS